MRANRTKFSSRDKKVLTDAYAMDKYLSPERMAELCVTLDKKESAIKNWFRNQRRRDIRTRQDEEKDSRKSCIGEKRFYSPDFQSESSYRELSVPTELFGGVPTEGLGLILPPMETIFPDIHSGLSGHVSQEFAHTFGLVDPFAVWHQYPAMQIFYQSGTFAGISTFHQI